MNIEEKINDLQKQIESHNQLVSQQMLELQQLLLQQNNKIKETLKEKNVQELVIGERKQDKQYYVINTYNNDIKNHVNNFDHVDKRLYESFNYFQDKNEAERYLRLSYLNNKMIRIRNYVNDGWFPDNPSFFIINLYEGDKEDYNIFDGSSSTSPLFFETKTQAQQFEKLVDREELIKYLQLMEGYMPNA